ncbi:MAG: hypothetical protein AB7I50_26860 [Vicinamibacterales bacterium]
MAIQLPVEVKYLHHKGPHHSDSPERRADKERISAEARRYEGRYFVSVDTPIEQWTGADVKHLLELVSARMPTRNPDPDAAWWRFEIPGCDGRGIHTVFCQQRPRLTNGLEPESYIWFSTMAGFSAKIALPAFPPLHALADVGIADCPWFNVEWRLDGRALAAHTRRARTDEERRSQGRPPLKRAVLASAFETVYQATAAGPEPEPWEEPDDRLAYVVQHRPYPEGERTTRRVRLPWRGGALDLIRQAARLVPDWVPLRARLVLSDDAKPSKLELDFGTDDADVRTLVDVELEVSDLAAVVPTMLRSLKGNLTGAITAELGDVGDDGEELPVPTVNDAALREMATGSERIQ